MSAQQRAVPAGSATVAAGPSRLRDRIAGLVPPGQALPDRQPAYVASWIYVFGVLTLAALVVVDRAPAASSPIGGAAWWHTSSFGHFVNSLHLWSVELFFAVMVIHLWGKFWMAAWRGNRGADLDDRRASPSSARSVRRSPATSRSRTSTPSGSAPQAKDGLNAVGVGAFFNVLNPGQMLLWHVVLLPLVVGVIVVLHVILVRRHGVVPPIDARSRRSSGRVSEMATATRPHERQHRPGHRTAGLPRLPDPPYDLVKEFVIALGVVALLTIVLAAIFSSPDEKAITMRRLGQGRPARRRRDRHRRAGRHHDQRDLRRAVQPRHRGPEAARLPLQKWGGVRHPGRLRNDLVVQPLCRPSRATCALKARPRAAGTPPAPSSSTAWATAYADALAKAPDGDPATGRARRLRSGAALAASFARAGRSGGLEGTLTSPEQLLRRRPDPPAAAALRRRLPRGPGPRPAPRRRPVGHDERDRQLPRPAVDVALHVLVPDQAVLDLATTPTPWSGA